MEASGTQAEMLGLDLRGFIKAFVAGLVTRGYYELRPQEPRTRRGFARVVGVLEEAALRVPPEGRRQKRELATIANDLRESNTGSFDGFASALRQVQLTFTTSPNPDYDEILLSVPEPYARATLDALPEAPRALVDRALAQFHDAISGTDDDNIAGARPTTALAE